MVSIFEEINQERAQKGLPPIIGTKPTTGENSPTSTLNFTTGAQALGLGAADMANSTVLGFGGQLLATLGDLIERVSPFSGEGISENDRKIFNKWGYTDEEINAKYPREDSWITSAAKSTLQQGLENQDYLRQLELETLGDNPSYGVRATRGTGTSLSYALLGALAALAGGGPFAVAAAMGIPEAASESGGTMIDAYRQGRYDDGGVAAANKAFLANVPLNVGLDFFLNPINGKAFVGGIKDPLLRWLGKGAASIANEGLQEPSQDTISEAAMNSLNKGTGFMSELGEGLKQWPERAWQLFPEVAGSTALTHLIMGVLPGNIPGSIAHEYAYNRQLEQGQQSAPQIKETVDRLTNDPLIETLKERLDEAGKKEVGNLQADIEAVIKNLNTVGYNDYQGLDQNLIHLENIKQAMQNYGKSVSEIKMNTIQEQQRQAYTQAQAQIQAMQAAQAEQQRVAAENAAQREYLRQWREANPPTVETTPEIKALPSGLTEQNKQAPTQEVKQPPTQQQEQKTAVIEETPDIIEGAQNNTGHAKTSAGTQVDFRYRVIEAGDLITSHKDNFSLNPDYDQRLQPRDKSSKTNQRLIIRIANAPDPERLEANILASDGAPMIDKHRRVISGNTRSIGLRRAYKQKTANNYHSWLIQNASNFGLDANRIEQMENPVLVREITSDLSDKDMIKFAREANESSIMGMDDTEQAVKDADLITEEDLVLMDFGKSLNAPANEKFIRQVISKMPLSEQARALDKYGDVSDSGILSVQRALIAKAYNDEKLVHEIAKSNDNYMKIISEGLTNAAPEMAKFENNNIVPELSIANDIAQAAKKLKTLREGKENVGGHNATGDLFDKTETDEVMTDEAKMLLEFLGTKRKNGYYRTSPQIRKGLLSYAKEAMKEAQKGQGTIPAEGIQRRTKKQILEQVLDNIYKKEARGVEEFEEFAIERKSEKRTLDSKETTVKTENTTQDTTTERLRQDVEKRLMDVGVSQKEAQINSQIFIKWEENFAKINGISLEQSLAAENLRFEFHDEIVEKDEAGHLISNPRAQMIIRNGEAILKITKLSDQSSILHEFGHLFLQRIYNLAKGNNLKEGTLKQNWDALLETYKITEQQLAENEALFKEVHERFATDLERYMREGKAPSEGLKHVFEVFKQWLRDIYASVRDIEYIGADRRRHSPRLSKEARQFFNYMLGDDVQQETTNQALGTLENGTFNQIIGEKGAKELDRKHGNTKITDNLAIAKQMTEAGKDVKTIRLATGWEKAPDGKWRYEIMDKNIRADRVEKAIARAEKGKGYPGLVTDFYRNKQLFDAYPQLTTLRLEFAKLNDDVVGEYDKKHDIIRLNTNEEYRDEIRSTIIHEIQHSIQDIEGFASGGSPNKFTSKSVQSLKDELQQLKDKIKGATEKSERSQIQKRIKRVKAAINFANDAQTDSIIETDNYFYTDADEAYENLGGEVEARNAENRIDLTAKERREQTLSDTQDTNEWEIAFNQASKKTKRKNKEPSFHQKILNYLEDYFTGKEFAKKERERREALVRTIRTPLKAHHAIEQIKHKQTSGQPTAQEKTHVKPSSFSDGLPDTAFVKGEERWMEAKRGVQRPNIIKQGKRIVKNLAEGFKGSYAELQGNDDNGNSLWPIKTRFDKLAREQNKMADDVMEAMTGNLKGLNDWQLDLFTRVRVLNDLKWRIDDFEKSGRGTPGLPYGWAREDFEKNYEKINAIIKDPKNKAVTDAVMKAVEAEEKAMRKIALDFVDAADKLGIKLGKRFPNPHYFHHVVLEYAEAAAEAQSQGRRTRTMRDADAQDFVNAKLRAVFGRDYLRRYKGSAGDISANYFQAMGEVRSQMVIDTATMRALADVKEQYKDINLQFRENYKKAQEREQAQQEAGTFNQSSGNEEEIDIDKILPDGYELFSPSMSGLIKGANSLAENAFTQAFNEVSEQSGVPFNEILNVAGLNDEETFDQMFIIPKQVKKVLENMASRSNKRESILGHWGRKLTSMWKADVLYNPLRNFKYNLRNFTGDLDAIISGLGKDWMPYFPKASKDLWAYLRGEKASPEFQDYLDRAGGRMMFQTTMFDNARLAMEDKSIMRKVDPNAPLYKRAWTKSANVVKFLMNKEVELTQYRESLLRYTAYLTFQADMDKNNGVPTRWAASNKDEILALNDFRDRAYEMANDLLGAYDKISNTGKELRSMLMPFWSWQEVNMKRYYRLFKNGFSGNNAREGSLTQRLLMAKAAKIPFYSVAATSTIAKIAVLQAMMTAWNWCVTPDADDDLPKDVKSKAHITLGNWNGKVYYFDRLGAMADALDWFALDAWPLEFKELANGQQSLAQFAKKVAQAPINKFVGQLNPFLKMPIELATGRSFYPDVFKSKTITDSGEHIARSLAVEWPYKGLRKLFTGKPFSNAEEAMKVFAYSIDPEEAAYFNTLDTVRKFKERVLDKHFDGFASTKRGTVLRNLKAAIRLGDKAAVQRYLREYRELDGTPQGLKQSMKAMNPLFGMNKEEQKQFMRWITPEDKKDLRRADRYWKKLAGSFIR